MTTDLDERITRALTARADALTVTRPPFDDVLAGTRTVPAPGGGRRRTVLLAAAAVALVLGAAAVVATGATDDGRVDLRPADEATTTTTPVLGLAYVPEGLPAEPREVTSPDGRATVLTYGSGDRVLEVAVVEATRSAELEDALDERSTAAIVAAYAAGGSVPAASDVPATPVGDQVLGAPAALPGRTGSVLADVRVLDDPLLLVLDAFPARGQRVAVGLVAFRAGAEVRIAGRGLGLDEATAVLDGLGGPGLAPRDRPAEEPVTAAPLPEGTSFLRPALTALPSGWGLSTISDLGGDPAQGVASASSGYGPAGAPPVDPDVSFPPGPVLDVTLSRSRPLPQRQEVLDAGGDDALKEVFGMDDLGTWVSGAEERVIDVGGSRLVATTGTVDETTVASAGGTHEMTWVIGQLGPDLRIEVLAEGLTEDQLITAIRSLVLVR